MPVPFLDVLIKYRQHRTYRAWSCSGGLWMLLGCYTVLNEDIQKGTQWHSYWEA